MQRAKKKFNENGVGIKVSFLSGALLSRRDELNRKHFGVVFTVLYINNFCSVKNLSKFRHRFLCA